MLLARGTTCMLCMVCSTFCFSALKVVVLHSQESFFLRIHLNFFSLIRSCTSSQQDLRRLSFLLNSLSLTLQPLRPMLAKVNKTYEQYRHFNDPVVVLLVGKIHGMKFLLSCTSSRQDLRRLRKYYHLEIQLVYLLKVSHFTFVVCLFYFSMLQINLTLLGITFFTNTFTFCSLLFSL